MQEKADQRRFVTLIGVSLLLHAVVLWLCWKFEPPPVPRQPGMVLEELTWVEAQPEKVAEPVAPSTPQMSLKKPPSQKPSQGEQRSSADATSPTGPAMQSQADLPLATKPSLLPSSGFALQLGPAAQSEQSRGSTLRNGPGEAPDPRALNEYTGEVLTRKLNTDLAQEVGLAAVAVGNVPGHFKHFENAMRQALPKANIDRTPLTAGEVGRDIAGVLFNNGPSAEAARKVTDTPLGRSVQNQNVMLPNTDDQRFREQSLQLLAQGENIKERLARARLRTVLEVTTDASGALANVSIVERSGDARFDESVVHFSRKVARTLPDNDDKMLGTSMWRARWQFTWEPPDVRVRLLNAWRVTGAPELQ